MLADYVDHGMQIFPSRIHLFPKSYLKGTIQRKVIPLKLGFYCQALTTLHFQVSRHRTQKSLPLQTHRKSAQSMPGLIHLKYIIIFILGLIIKEQCYLIHKGKL